MEQNSGNACGTGSKSQIQALKDILLSDRTVHEALNRAAALGLEQYYIGAGFLTQTVWNALFGNPSGYGIKDIDFVYYDSTDLSFEAENAVIEKVKSRFAGLPIEVDVKNQARVHLWYKNRFGSEIAPYHSLEAAIDTWPTTATAVGVRLQPDGTLKIYAPFGLNDLFGKIVRPNKAQITKEIYENKVVSWLRKWPELIVIPWDK